MSTHESKKIIEKLGSLELQQAIMNAHLEEHMKRTELLENDLKAYKAGEWRRFGFMLSLITGALTIWKVLALL